MKMQIEGWEKNAAILWKKINMSPMFQRLRLKNETKTS